MITLPTDAEMVQVASSTYTTTAAPFIDHDGTPDRVFLTTRADGMLEFAIEGTYNLPGWVNDFLALGVRDHEVTNHPTLGFLHAGFYESAIRLLPRMELAAKGKSFSVQGHSRGASLALLLGALMIDDGMSPVKVGAFAPARIGGALCVKIATSIPFCAYRFGNDPVPEVPFTLLPDFPYQQVPLTMIGHPMLVAVDCHNIANYVTGVYNAVIGEES